jgi:hypothetical protein
MLPVQVRHCYYTPIGHSSSRKYHNTYRELGYRETVTTLHTETAVNFELDFKVRCQSQKAVQQAEI